MTEQEIASAQPEPFATTPKGPAGLGGCGKPAVVGCVVLLLLLFVALLLFIWKAGDLFRWTLTQVEEQFLANLPAEVSAEERERLEAAFEAAIEAVTRGESDPRDLQELQRSLAALSRRIDRLTREDVLELIEVLERVGGQAGAPEPGRSPPGPGTESPPPGSRVVLLAPSPGPVGLA